MPVVIIWKVIGMSDVKRVLIVGCGIGGATAAYALRRVGIDVHCVELKNESSAVGTGISLLHNVVRALKMIGLADECIGRGQLTERFRQFDAAGNVVSVNPTPPGIGIRRPDLANVLETAAMQAGAVIDWGVTVQDLTDHGHRVEVVFSDGRRGDYDLVVAADGAYSKLRAKVFGPEHAPWFAGQSAWRFSAPRPPEHDGFFLWRDRQGRGLGAIPTSKDTCYLFTLVNSKEHIRMPDDQLISVLRQRLSEYTAPFVRQALESVTKPEDVFFRPFDIRLMPGPWWHRGRVVLLGDAAHSPTPQMTSGGGLAIEDAVVLAEELTGPGSAIDALERYSRRRIPRVNRVWEASLQLCRYEQQDDPIATRDKATALLLATYQFLGEPM
jgi:2-polyprenyl-6-methoxyphenol hydroxylase-like FAD-dependent oxidoreductase